LDNAVEYSPAVSRIFISLQATGLDFELRITNTAASLARGDVAKLFDRFWRADGARSGGDHTGLGLPLSRAFAEAMGWELEACSPEEHRLTLRLMGLCETV
jgi:signal transduction histidine kinase